MTWKPKGDVEFEGDVAVGGDITNAGLTSALAAKAPIDKPSFTGGKLYLARPSSGQDAVIQFRNEINIDSAAVALLGTADALSFRTGTTERMRIDSAGLITGTGTSLGAWTAYTPTLGGTGWALGDGTASGKYVQVGKIVHFKASIIFGSTSTYGSAAPTLTLPVTAVGGSGGYSLIGSYLDVSAATYYRAAPQLANTATLICYATDTAGGQMTAAISTVPFTWATSDQIVLTGTYEAA